MSAQGTSSPETLREWLQLSAADRDDALQSRLALIAALDPEIHAWVQLQPTRSIGGGSLHGVPFGAKDIMESAGLATEYGSPIYRGRIGVEDAAIVAELKGRGAVLLGKTQTTAFAYITSAPTRNPRVPDRTPGGSSSGSAAAVAAGMVPFALGTQTKGSVLRPASYCGVTGFKPSYGLFSMAGILPVAHSLDTLGFFTHTAEDMRALWQALGRDIVDANGGDVTVGVPEPLPGVEPSMADAFQRAVSRLREHGVRTRPLDLSAMLTALAASAHVVMFYEGARAHRDRYDEHGALLGDMADLVRAGLQIPDARYEEARQHIDACKGRVERMFDEAPVIAVPAATGPAPLGLGYTGDPAMNAPWTALGTPAISIPMPGAGGPPLGLQLTARHGQDAQLLGAAVRVSGLLGSAGRLGSG